jgi:hypothetical protein
VMREREPEKAKKSSSLQAQRLESDLDVYGRSEIHK